MLALPEERVCLEARRHGIVLARPLGEAVVLAALGTLLLAQAWPAPVAGAVALAAGAVAAARAVWKWERTRVVVTTEKLLLLEGTLRRRVNAVHLARLESVAIEQSAIGRVLGYGTIVAGDVEVAYVPEPRRVYGLMERRAA